jgi:hypothetical protein
MVSPGINGSASQKKSTNHMAIRAWFITGATRGIGGRRSQKSALVDGNQVVASDREPQAVTEALGTYL